MTVAPRPADAPVAVARRARVGQVARPRHRLHRLAAAGVGGGVRQPAHARPGGVGLLGQTGGCVLRLRLGLGFGRIVTSEIEVPNVSESGMKWMSGSTKRQCDRALAEARPTRRLLRDPLPDRLVDQAPPRGLGDRQNLAVRFVLSDILLGSNASDFRLGPSLCRGGLFRQGCDCSFSPDSGVRARAYNFLYLF